MSNASSVYGGGGGGSAYLQHPSASSSMASPPLSYIMQPSSTISAAQQPRFPATTTAAPSVLNNSNTRSMMVADKDIVPQTTMEDVASVIEVSESEVSSAPAKILSTTSKPTAFKGAARGAGFDPLLDDDDDDVAVLTHGGGRGSGGGMSSLTIDRNNAPTPSPFVGAGVPSAYTLSGSTTGSTSTATSFSQQPKKKNPMDLFSDDE